LQAIEVQPKGFDSGVPHGAAIRYKTLNSQQPGFLAIALLLSTLTQADRASPTNVPPQGIFAIA